MKKIEIDDELFGVIKERAEPFVDTPNSVLRRMIGLDPGGGERSNGVSGRGRAPAGSLLPESEYELPLLQELLSRGGSAPAKEITAAVGERLVAKLTDRDREVLDSGDVRWENRVHFTRLRLKERGLLKSGSARGIWELSRDGRRAAEKSNR
ncbi:MAG TPA: winged helix-turn-helix domain-containing protein [Solirubrobacterales bacterium]|jgi:hypothetical protein|nr:winged helix-turn-helix domain-containing protein [Solirubrobacterales bacterium]